MKKFFQNLKTIFLFLILSALPLSACGANAANPTEQSPLTADETVDELMKNLKDLNLDFFNEHSDNYVSTERNWLGISTRKEYQVFSELLQPFRKNGKRYQSNYQFFQKLMKNLTWEIKDVRKGDTQAEIDMEITNIDMMKAIGYYEIYLLENMISGEDTDFSQFVRDIVGLVYSEGSDGLSLAMDKLDKNDVSTVSVTLLAYQEDGIWKIHLNEDFINAFMGNINSENYPSDIEQKIEELTLQYEEKMNRMADQFEQKWDRLTD